jgi:hypothetical protein
VFDYQTVYNAYTALIAGLITSVHCVGMCGPLSCAFAPRQAKDASPQLVLTCYHLAKLISYAVVGTLAGVFGSVILVYVEASWLNLLPWMLVVFFLVVATRLDRFFPKPVWLSGLYRAATARFLRLQKPLAAAIIGLASPLLPCGPLYMIFGLAFVLGLRSQGGRICDRVRARDTSFTLAVAEPVHASSTQGKSIGARPHPAAYCLYCRPRSGLAFAHNARDRRGRGLGLSPFLELQILL